MNPEDQGPCSLEFPQLWKKAEVQSKQLMTIAKSLLLRVTERGPDHCLAGPSLVSCCPRFCTGPGWAPVPLPRHGAWATVSSEHRQGSSLLLQVGGDRLMNACRVVQGAPDPGNMISPWCWLCSRLSKQRNSLCRWLPASSWRERETEREE